MIGSGELLCMWFVSSGIMMHKSYLVIFHNYFAPSSNPMLLLYTVVLVS